MADSDTPTLLAATGIPSAEIVSWIESHLSGRTVVAALLTDDCTGWSNTSGWVCWKRGDLEDTVKVRDAFLSFIDNWPRRPLGDGVGASFDDRFRHADGYSIWWTGPGAARHPDRGVFAQLRDVWAIATAIERSRCDSIVLATNDPLLASIVATKCRELGIGMVIPPGCARPANSPWKRRAQFALSSILKYLVSPWSAALRAWICRRRVRWRPDAPADRKRPAIVMSSLFPREFRNSRDSPDVAFWSPVVAEIGRTAPDFRVRHLLHTNADRFGDRGVDRLGCHRAWTELRSLKGLAPLPNQFVGWRGWISAALPFLRTLIRYCRLEGGNSFRQSFRFADCDVAALYVPLLRCAIERTGTWTRQVATYEACFRAVGNVRAAFVYGEMYPLGMPVIAAARKLGIVTIGVQHGTVFPMHLIYTVPRGHVEGAPTPDWFAAYGEFAKETLCRIGSFPIGRVVITGGPRLDASARLTAGTSEARRSLQLPCDRRIILFATQSYPWFRIAARALFAATAGRRDCLVCIKTHPHEKSVDQYRSLAAEAGATNVQFYEDRFDDLLAACDILISGSSTATLEAILAQRDVICVNFSGEAGRYPYVREGGALGASNADELRAALDAVLNPSKKNQHETARREFLRRHVGPSADGNATSVFVDTVLSIIDRT